MVAAGQRLGRGAAVQVDLNGLSGSAAAGVEPFQSGGPPVDGVDSGHGLQARLHHRPPLGGRGLVHHEAALAVAGVVGGHPALNEAHHVEGLAQDAGIGLVAHQRRHRRRARGGHRLHGPVLHLHRHRALRGLDREDAAVSGLDPPDVALGLGPAGLGPGRVEHDGLVGEAGGHGDVDAGHGHIPAVREAPGDPVPQRRAVVAAVGVELGDALHPAAVRWTQGRISTSHRLP